MVLKACPVPGKEKSRMLCEAFIAGAPRDAVGWVFYGVKEGNVAAWRNAQAQREPVYFVDGSYFDSVRGTQFRVTKDAIQHTGEGATDCQRFIKLGLAIAPWRVLKPGAGYVLMVEQSIDHWRYTCGLDTDPLIAAEQELRRRNVTDLRFRRWSANKPKLHASLAEDLLGARLLVTHTSAAAVMAVLAGVPVACNRACAAHSFREMEGDRLRWAGVLADNQFTISEMKDGTAWRKLNP